MSKLSEVMKALNVDVATEQRIYKCRAGHYIEWNKPSASVLLDGRFNADQLQALAEWLRDSH